MKKQLLIVSLLLALALPGFGQSGENLPAFGNIYACATTPSAGTNAVQTLTFGATITGGSFKLKFDNYTTGAINWSNVNATLVAAIQAALDALPHIKGSTVSAGTIVSGAGGTVLVTVTGDRAKQPVPAMTVASNSLTGGAATLTAALSTPGVAADGRIAPKGSLCVALDTGVWYANTGTPPNPVWVKLSTQ